MVKTTDHTYKISTHSERSAARRKCLLHLEKSSEDSVTKEHEKIRGEAEVSTDISEWIIKGHFERPTFN